MPLLPPTPLVPDAPVRPVALREPGEGMVGMAGGHQLLWLAAVADMPLAYDLARRGAAAYAGARTQSSAKALTVAVIDVAARGDSPAALADPRAASWFVAPAAPVQSHPPLRRWSGDAWLLWRRGGDSATGGGSVLLPSYGAIRRVRCCAIVWRPPAPIAPRPMSGPMAR
jgi:hypothetical protein